MAVGFDCHSVGMTLFDGREEYPLHRLFGPEHASTEHVGRILEAEHRGVTHHLFRTASTIGRNVTREEAGRFLVAAKRLVQSVQPDIVVTTGGSALARTLHGIARDAGACRVFYLGNAEYDRPEIFEGFDHVWCPTRALAEYHRDYLGIDPEIFPTVLDSDAFVEPRNHRPEGFRRYVTIVNPTLSKGASLFLRIAQLAARERPDIRFLAVESRASREQWREQGVDPAALPNVDWVRNRSDMRPVYRRTAVLLFPSLCFEAAGRVPVEAQLSGIPVLATNRGGIPEQLNGGGFLFEPPARCVEDYLAMPAEDEVRPWLNRIVTLIDDRDAYTEASRAARAAAEPFHPRTRHPQVIQTFTDLVRSRPGSREAATSHEANAAGAQGGNGPDEPI